jgi:anti-sigma factor RsiW
MLLCNDIEHNLSAYLEGTLSPEVKTIVEEHLASCPHCTKAVENLKKTEKLAREMEEVEPPPWFAQKIMSHVREEAQLKESLFRKLFYPLHIKIPIQALTTVPSPCSPTRYTGSANRI